MHPVEHQHKLSTSDLLGHSCRWRITCSRFSARISRPKEKRKKKKRNQGLSLLWLSGVELDVTNRASNKGHGTIQLCGFCYFYLGSERHCILNNAILTRPSPPKMAPRAEEKLAAAAVPLAKICYTYKKPALVTAVITIGLSIYGWVWYRNTTLTYGSPDGILTAKAQVALQVGNADLLAMAAIVCLSFPDCILVKQKNLTLRWGKGRIISRHGRPRPRQTGDVTMCCPCMPLLHILDSRCCSVGDSEA
jgi:hypothetical protein